MPMPAQRPHKSKQDYCTPIEFLDAVRRRLNIVDFDIDLAASSSNTVAPIFFTEEMDSLTMDWAIELEGWAWCNPPYSDIGPWAEKAWEESQRGAHIAMLIPASVGANWWRDWVHNKAHVLLLNGRISFDGKAPYPKDCALLIYTPFVQGGYDIWNWRTHNG